jgi:hypothetical protein
MYIGRFNEYIGLSIVVEYLTLRCVEGDIKGRHKKTRRVFFAKLGKRAGVARYGFAPFSGCSQKRGERRLVHVATEREGDGRTSHRCWGRLGQGWRVDEFEGTELLANKPNEFVILPVDGG